MYRLIFAVTLPIVCHFPGRVRSFVLRSPYWNTLRREMGGNVAKETFDPVENIGHEYSSFPKIRPRMLRDNTGGSLVALLRMTPLNASSRLAYMSAIWAPSAN